MTRIKSQQAATLTKVLNREQLAAIHHRAGPLLIIAGAGTGKTTVITERIKYFISKNLAKPQEILALTFTQKAAREMEERVDQAMPYGYTQMWISTFHSFCDRVLRQEGLHIGLDPQSKLMTEAEAIQFIRSHLFQFKLNYFRPLGNPNKFVSSLIQHFSRLQDEDITPRQYLRFARNLSRKKREDDSAKKDAAKTQELAQAYQTYDQLKVKTSVLDFSDLITKTLLLFRTRPNVLKQYQNRFKYILVDEYQDTNIAQNELVKLLSKKEGNINVVCDDDQCLPPSTKIETPQGKIPIKNLKVSDKVITCVGKGYLSTSKIIYINKTKKTARLLTFITESGKKLEVTDNHKMFCMIPGREYGQQKRYYLYLMWRAGMGWRLGITNDLAQRLRLERSADKILAIKSYPSLDEARFFETVFSLKYHIPTYPFKPRKDLKLTGEWLRKLFSFFDTEKNAQNLAHDLDIDLQSYHYCLAGVVRGEKERIKVILNMCLRKHRTKWARNRILEAPKIRHEVTLESSSKRVKRILAQANLVMVKAKKGWRIKKRFVDLQQAGNFAQKLTRLTNGILEIRFDIGKRNGYSRPALVMPASNILPGMHLPVIHNFEIIYERVIDRKEKIRRTIVYDLEVENSHNFIANNIAVHNSIYKWRGAAISNVIQFRQNFPQVKLVTLTKNYRSGQEILDKAYQLIQHNNPDRLEVAENIDKKLIAQRKAVSAKIQFIHQDRVENEADVVAKKIASLTKDHHYQYQDIAILVRANNHSEPFARALARHHLPYQFLGPGRLFRKPEILDLIAYLKVLYNFEDSVAFYRLLALDHFHLSARDLAKIGNDARRLNLSLFETCEKIDDLSVSPDSKEKIKTILALINHHLKLSHQETAGQLLYYFLEESGLMKTLINSDSAEAEIKAQNISKFFDKLKTYEVDHDDATVFPVVDWLELSTELGESPLAIDTDWTQENRVNILTIHSAKGLEFPVVFLVNLVAQRFPTLERREPIPIPEPLIKEVLPTGDYHLQEERRLFYVGVTRAKNLLFFTAADYYGEGKREKKLSPFIFEALGDDALAAEQTPLPGEQLSFLDYASPTPQPSLPQAQPIHVDYLSYSQIETFRTCPLHYKLRYLLKIPTPPTPALSFGISIHAALRDFYLLLKAGQKPTLKLLLKSLATNWLSEGYASKTHREKMFAKGNQFLTKFFEKEFDPQKIPFAVEQSFVVPLSSPQLAEPRLKIGGKIDRVDLLQNGQIEIIDYKTGANVPTQKEVDHDLQLTFYALAATNIQEPPYPKKPADIILSLYYFDTQTKISTQRTKDQLAAAIQEIFDYRRQIEASDFNCSHHPFCQNCEYSLICRTDR